MTNIDEQACVLICPAVPDPASPPDNTRCRARQCCNHQIHRTAILHRLTSEDQITT
jgi:hypothetical protein